MTRPIGGCGRCLVGLLVLLAFARGTAYASPVAEGDALAHWGAYRAADRLYVQALREAGADKVALLLKRLAVAEALKDRAAVAQLIHELEGLPGVEANPEAQMRTALARASLAVRLGRTQEAAQQMTRVESLATRLRSPGARLARYVTDTWRYGLEVTQNGRPTPEAFVAASAHAAAPLADLPLAVEPTDMVRAAEWGRFWVRQPLLYMADAWRVKDMAAAAAWYKVASDIAVAGRASLRMRGSDPEALTVAQLYAVDMAAGVCGNTPVAEGWLQAASGELEQLELASRGFAAGKDVVFIELLRVRSLVHRARALVDLAAGQGRANDPKTIQGLREYGLALDAARAAGLVIDVIDLRNELAAAELTVAAAGSASVATGLADVVRTCRELDYIWGLYVAFYWQGRMYVGQGNLPAAEDVLRQAVGLGEKMIAEMSAGEDGRREMLARGAAVYELLIDVLVRQGKIPEAVDVGDRQRQSAVLAGLDVSKVRTRNPEVGKALAEVAVTRDRASLIGAQQQALAERPAEVAGGGGFKATQIGTTSGGLVQQLADNRAQFYQALNRIRAVDPDYERLVNIRPTSFSKLQSRLPADTLLVQYFLSADKLYVFTATAQQLRIHLVAAGRDSIAADVSTVRSSFSQAVRRSGAELDAEAADALVRLHGWLIGPIESDLARARTLVVVPSGPLYYLPFAALASRRDGRLQYLAERVPVVVMTSLELFDVVAARPHAQLRSILALGNPDGSLPGAQQEVGEVAALFKNAHVYLTTQATKSQLERIPAGTSVVHLATHGVLNPRDLNLSYVVMAGSGDAGRLTAGEIYGLDLREVSLVTLSACQTALGGANPGAEIATLAQAFSVAGSRSMLASLWSVSDTATRRLMVDFYGNVARGSNLAAALQAAQRSMIARPETAHPAYWAAFELIGDWR